MTRRKALPFIPVIVPLLLGMALPAVGRPAAGIVFHDLDGDRTPDPDEPGVAGVGVSNGRDVTVTDDDGRWRLEVDDDDIIFVIKPRGWRPVMDENGTPRGYYVHKPGGSPPLRYGGVEPTGRMPRSIDFAMYRQREPRRFKAIFFGDPQVTNEWQVRLLAHDVIDPIVTAGTDAVVTFSLGDIANNNLDMLPRVQGVMGTLGLPNYYVLGNHDENYDASSDDFSDETWERVMGPPWYSLNWGPVHFIVLDDVIWHPPAEGEDKGRYTGGIDDEQMEFIRNDLARVPGDRLIVYMFHIPVTGLANRAEFLALFEGRPNVLGMSAHTHRLQQMFIGKEQGWWRDEPHHHYVAPTSCGSWWRGELDWWGIPETPCQDGVPNGYSEVTFDGNDYAIEYVPSRYPRSFQMDIWTPTPIDAAEAAGQPVYVNVFAGSERSEVRMRVNEGDWVTLERTPEPTEEDVAALRARQQEALAAAGADRARELGAPLKCGHLWKGQLPEGLTPGYHTVEVHTTDMFGHTYDSTRTFELR